MSVEFLSFFFFSFFLGGGGGGLFEVGANLRLGAKWNKYGTLSYPSPSLVSVKSLIFSLNTSEHIK